MNVSSCLRLHLTLRVIKELEWLISHFIMRLWQSPSLKTERRTLGHSRSESTARVLFGWVGERVDSLPKWLDCSFPQTTFNMLSIHTELPLCGSGWTENVLGVSSPMTNTVAPRLATKRWQGEDGGCGREQTSTPSDQDPRKGVFLFGFVIVRHSPF